MAEKKNTGNISEIEVTNILKNIGEMIKTERTKKNWSMADLADKSGISSSLISDLENKKGKVPNIFTLISIARALNLADDEFIKSFWRQSKTVRRKNKQSEQESEVRKSLLEYGIPQKALGGVMDYINMIIKAGNMYEIWQSRTNGMVKDKKEADEKFALAEQELLKLYSDFVR